MAIPELIPIRCEPDYRTGTIGKFAEGQFFGWVTGAYAPGDPPRGADWKAYQRWYAVLHRFDDEGRHTGTDAWCPGPGIREGATERLASWLDALPGRVYRDIAIRPFQLEVDGIRFGLVPECHGDYLEGEGEVDWAEFYPGRLGFSAPWSGRYDT
jgi:hypothetical protein